MTCSASASNCLVVTPGSITRANSANVMLTKRFALRSASISSSVFRYTIEFQRSICSYVRCTRARATRIEQAIIMTYQQMALNLLYRIKNNTDQNQQGCSSEELGKALINSKNTGKCWHNGNQSNKQRSRKGNSRHHVVKIVCRTLSRFDTWNEAIVTFHILGHLHWIKCNSRIEICKRNDQKHEYDIVQHARMIHKLS